MRNDACIVLLVGCLASMAAPSALAHHGEGATTTGKQPIVWQGTIARVSWDGPHVMYLVDVANAAGQSQRWQVLGGSPSRLRTRGISQRTLRAGLAVTVAGYLNPLSRIVTPVYLALSGGPKFYVGYVSSDTGFALPAAASMP